MNLEIINIENFLIVLISVTVGILISLFFRNRKKRDDYSTIKVSEALLDNDQNELCKLNVLLFKSREENEQLKITIRNKNKSDSGDLALDNEFLNDNKKFKEEIEELEFEVNDYQSRIKKIKREKDELSNKMEVADKNEKILTAEKNKLIIMNSAQEIEIKEKSESLNFINDILNASNSNDDQYDVISKNTNLIVHHIKNEINNCLEEVNLSIADEEYNNWQNLELKSWIKNKKVIAIVGEFSAGKTSIVNRILSQDDPNAVLLPVNSKETTAIPTYISNGIDFNCQFYSPSGELKNIRKETFETLTKSVLDKINISSLIKYFVISYNNKYLNNISILDTPGFGSNSDEIIN